MADEKVKQYFNPTDPVTFLGDDEVVDFDPNRDPYERKPPIADGEYVFELRLASGQKIQHGPWTDSNGKKQTWILVPLELQVQSPGAEQGRMTFDKAGFREMGNILNSAFSAGLTHEGQRAIFSKFLNTIQGHPQVTVETQWQAECRDCQEATKTARKAGATKKRYYPFKRGQAKFAVLDAKGNITGYEPNVQCPNCKGEVRARAVPIRYSAATAAPAKGFAASAGAGSDDDISF